LTKKDSQIFDDWLESWTKQKFRDIFIS